jgi:putative PIN family toxin of toxin-antitoxin system
VTDLRVVCDTNVFIAAALRGEQSETIIQLAAAGAITLIVSPPILAELEGKLRNKFGWTPEQTAVFLEAVRLIAEVIEPEVTVHVIEDDPDDDRILECALAGQAALIVTYDKHLLKLKQYQFTGIIHPVDLLHFGLESDAPHAG